MKLLIHDFAGHPFQIQLSRELAQRGHTVIHLYPVGLPGPKGALDQRSSDSDSLEIRGVQLSGQFRKYSPIRRLATQRGYARQLRLTVSAEQPDVVLSGNTPIDVQAELLSCCHRHDIGFVHWIQDIYFQALTHVLRPKFGRVSKAITLPFRSLEKWVVSGSDAVIAIAPGFREYLAGIGVEASEFSVIENWAPLDEVPVLPRRNAWSEQTGLNGEPVFLYSGTLGLKHRPEMLYDLARAMQGTAKVVVVTEGIGRDYLERMPRLDNLALLGFQPYDRLPEVLASADVLVATLEPDAGQFAVPSKILSYLCAGRPILLAAPKQNLSVSVVNRSGAGLAVDPHNKEAWISAARKLAASREYRDQLGLNGRAYAERTFDIAAIANLFEDVLIRANKNRTMRSKTSLKHPRPARVKAVPSKS